MSRRVNLSIPLAYYKNFLDKQTKMSSAYQKITGKPKKISLVRVIGIASANPIYLDDGELVSAAKRRKI